MSRELTWQNVAVEVPPGFRDNGASSPLQFLYGFIYWGGRRRADIAFAARLHDFGYGPGRLTGSPFAIYSRAAWDEMYRTCLLDRKHHIIAERHYKWVRILGGRPWKKNADQMVKWEWLTYKDFLTDVDQTYSLTTRGVMTD